MKKYIFLLLIITINYCSLIFAQDYNQYFGQEYFNRLNKTITSPEASAFQKYSYYPISPSTGTVDISIPILSISQGQLTHNISLDYHNGGIKVNDVSTSVGLGWLLNAGGAIVRSQQGALEDEYLRFGYLKMIENEEIPTKSHIDRINYLTSLDNYCNYEEWNDFFYFCQGAMQVNSQSIYGKGKDLEPDLFSYNFQGKSGVFYFSDTGEIVSECMEPIKIEYIFESKFKITDKDGIIYFFEKGQTSSVSHEIKLLNGHFLYLYETPNNQIPFGSSEMFSGDNVEYWHYLGDSNPHVPPGWGPTFDSNNSWYLKEIIHPNNQDTIFFDYKVTKYESQPHCSQSKEIVFRHGIKVGGLYLSDNNVYDINLIQYNTTYEITDYLIEKIRFNSGEVIFNYINDRKDSKIKERLESIVCKNSKEEIVTHVKLDNNKYFNANFDVNESDDLLNKRLKLEKIIFKNNSTDSMRYQFGYNEAILPPINSKSVDFWGYFNGKFNQTLIPKIKIVENNPSSGVDEHVAYGSADRTANEEKMQAFILNKIIYPSNGMTEFYYSCHKVLHPIDSLKKINIGGLRTKAMKLYPDYNNTSDYTKKEFEYSYKGNADIGRSISNIGPELNFQPFKRHAIRNNAVYTESFIIHSSPVNQINLPGFSNVIYHKVIEKELSTQGNILGKKEFVFNIESSLPSVFQNDCVYCGFFGLNLHNVYDYFDSRKLKFHQYPNSHYLPIKTYYPLESRPYLIEENVYDNNNVKVKGTYKTYTIKDDENKLVRGMYLSSYNEYTKPYYYYGSFPLNRYKYYYFAYEIPIQKRQLESQTDSILTQNGYFSTITNFEYEDTNGLLRKTTTIDSNNKEVIEEKWYPFDYSNSIPIIEKLNSKHILIPPLMHLKKIDNKTVDGTIMEISEYGEPTEFFNLKKHTNSAVAFNSNIISQHADFENTASIRNERGRIVEKKLKGNTPVTYLWSYNNQYPFVEIAGATYNSVVSVLGAQAISSFAKNINPTLTEITNFLKPLVTNEITQNAQIITYTYKPLVGVTSITDPRGITTYYEYDSFGRLEFIKDNQQNIIEKYEYHYKPQ